MSRTSTFRLEVCAGWPLLGALLGCLLTLWAAFGGDGQLTSVAAATAQVPCAEFTVGEAPPPKIQVVIAADGENAQESRLEEERQDGPEGVALRHDAHGGRLNNAAARAASTRQHTSATGASRRSRAPPRSI